LRDGPEVGVHTAVVVDGLGQFDRRLGRDALKEFDWRIVGSGVAPNDVGTITDSYAPAEIRPSQLLIADASRGRSRRVRAYPRHTSHTIKEGATP
jgi:hypothetical protein